MNLHWLWNIEPQLDWIEAIDQEKQDDRVALNHELHQMTARTRHMQAMKRILKMKGRTRSRKYKDLCKDLAQIRFAYDRKAARLNSMY
jgi:tRNA A37 threonylcarbamoyladenosine synthetase subunit TsaC/SUA5/YrdC